MKQKVRIKTRKDAPADYVRMLNISTSISPFLDPNYRETGLGIFRARHVRFE